MNTTDSILINFYFINCGSSYISKFYRKIVICESSHILQINVSFVVIPALEYDRFNSYKLLFYKLW
ncbi:hypothetical protein C5473_17780 [Leptospira interrogans serovar Weerasinghe]|nr:hypothetical protein C5473_17780 [Leptospira interrogans serovar Weerasinghe]